MRAIVTLLCLLVAAMGCTSPERQVQRIERQMLEQLPPLLADEVQPVIMTPSLLDSAGQVCDDFRKRLDALSRLNLKPHGRADLNRAERFLSAYEARVRSAAVNPASYNLGKHLKISLAPSSSPLHKRLSTLLDQMKRAAPYYAAARENIRNPDPDLTKAAIVEHLGALEFLQTALPDSIAAARLSEAEKRDLAAEAVRTRIEVKDYIAFCRSLLFEHGDTILARELYLKK